MPVEHLSREGWMARISFIRSSVGVVVALSSVLGVLSLIQQSRHSVIATHRHGRPISDPPNVLSGADNPSIIPDESAYSILFRILARSDTPERYRQNAAYIRFRIGITGGDCLFQATNGGVEAFPSVTFRSDEARPLDCPVGQRFVPHRDRLVTLARQYVRMIETVERDASDSVAQLGDSVPAAKAGAVRLARRTAINSILRELDGALGQKTAASVRRFVAEDMKRKMKIRFRNPNLRPLQ
jgi:hypothetical protein